MSDGAKTGGKARTRPADNMADTQEAKQEAKQGAKQGAKLDPAIHRYPMDQIFAHRGASGSAPENTCAAFQLASQMGAGWVEVDCMLTRDKRVVLNHDETLMRIAGLDRSVSEIELADLLHIDVGSRIGPQFAGETIPTLQRAIKVFEKCHLGANLEIKPCEGFDVETGEVLAAEISAHWPDQLPPPIISSFSETALRAAKPLLDPNIEVAMLWPVVPESWAEDLQRIGATAVHCSAQLLNAETARRIKSEGVPLRCYTVNSLETAERLFHWGVDAIFTDHPERFLDPR